MDNPKKHAAAASSEEAGASNKRFKHAHEGPNSIAQDEEEKQSSVVAVAAHASPIGGLCSNELGAVLDFLAIDELHHALAVSRSWSAIIRSSMPCARFCVMCPAESVAEMSSSALARHILEIRHKGVVRCKLTSDSLFILALAMPQLTSLHCELIPSAATMMRLPAKLERLEMDLSALDAGGINRALESIAQLTALSQLTLVLPSWLPELSFAPLSMCAALQTLALMGPYPGHTQPTDAHIDQLRALHHLRSVSIHRLAGASLTKLLRAPHALHWIEMGGIGRIDSVGAAALRHVPGLLTFDAWDVRDVSFLPALSQLQSLEVEIAASPWAVTADALVEAVSSCRQLTCLNLIAPFGCMHLTLLLPRLPLLRTLVLAFCSELESLSFLSVVPSLQRTLLELQLERCAHPALRSSELRHVLSLKQLTALRLVKSFAEPLDGLSLHLLTPPSTALPQLTSFDYKAVAPESGHA